MLANIMGRSARRTNNRRFSVNPPTRGRRSRSWLEESASGPGACTEAIDKLRFLLRGAVGALDRIVRTFHGGGLGHGLASVWTLDIEEYKRREGGKQARVCKLALQSCSSPKTRQFDVCVRWRRRCCLAASRTEDGRDRSRWRLYPTYLLSPSFC